MSRAVSGALFLALFFHSFSIHAADSAEVSYSPSRVIESYSKALELDPSDTKSRYYLGLSLLQYGKYAEGVEELLKAYPERENNPDINFNLGYAYLQMGKHNEALGYFTKVQQLGGGQEHRFRLDAAWLNLGYQYQSMGNEEEALLCFTNSLKVNPRNIKTYLLLAGLYSRKNDSEKALEYLERARAIDNKDEDIIRMISNTRNRLGVSYLNKKMHAEAREEFEKVLEMDSSNLYAMYYLGYVDYIEGDMENAALNLERLTALKVEDESLKKGLRPLIFNIGIHYLESGKHSKALEVLEKVLTRYPDFVKAHYYAGVAALEMRDYDGAIKRLERYLEAEPSDANAASQLAIAYDKAKEAHFETGKTAYNQRSYKKALIEFDKVLAISPEYGAAKKYRDITSIEVEKILVEEAKRNAAIVKELLLEGKTLLKEEELLVAQGKFMKAGEIAPANDEVKGYIKECRSRIADEVKVSLADAKRHLADKAYYKALKSSLKVISFDPGNKSAAENIKLAESHIEKLIIPYLKKAEKHMIKEEFRKAINAYEMALGVNPDNEEAFIGRDVASGKVELYFNEYIGMARDYTQVNQLRLARSHYEKAMELKPGDDLALKELALVDQKMGRVKSVGAILSDAQSALVRAQYNRAITGFSAVLKLEPANKEAKRGLKKATYMKLNKVSALVEQLEELFDDGKYHETIKLARNILTLEKGEERASNLLKKAKNSINKTVNPFMAKGKTLFKDGDINGAVLEFHKAIVVDPGNFEAKRYLSKVDEKKAKGIVKGALKKRYLNGLDAYTKGNYDKSIIDWNSVLELDPDHEKALLNIDKAKRKLAAIKGR